MIRWERSSLGDTTELKEKPGHHSLFQLMLAVVAGAFLTDDLFNLCVWIEVMLISSFSLFMLLFVV
jgi:multicomponent Na+:H+ antiporter subunit D